MKSALSEVFGAAVRWRGAAYDRGLLPVTAVRGVSVVSVGALAAGGSGKTPLAGALARVLSQRGPTAVVSRGYRGRLEGKVVEVSRGDGPARDPGDVGDEAWMLANSLRGIGVWIGADRVCAVARAAAAGARFVVLDDGFSHRRIHRDLDVLLVSPEDLRPGVRMLPAGRLREPPEAASRADVLVGLLDDWGGADDAPPVLLRYDPEVLVDPDWSESPVSDCVGARFFAVTGIARPERFLATARRAGLEVVGAHHFPDHHLPGRCAMERVAKTARARGATALLVTEKDLARGVRATMPLRCLRIRPELVGDALGRAVDALSCSGTDRNGGFSRKSP